MGWAVGFFAFSAGSIIHMLLVIAFFAIILRIIRGRRVLKKHRYINNIYIYQTKNN
ncbi:MAG: lmo0937 family membrane protein [Bacteroidales bacterium]|nr:lmo0937 family membrane protein [Bacteroidales bacterium]